ncbi:MAG TPA: lytic transglycosylase domain-containing protein [Candidatus Cybelea sp.]|nr:lytic transglycosylase domain-containing protein [Candidatus Cybelea sp.]
MEIFPGQNLPGFDGSEFIVLRVGLGLLLWSALTLVGGDAFADAGGLSTADIKLYQRAFDLANRDQWGDARALAAKAKNPLPAKVIQWLDLIRPGPGRSFTEMSSFMAKNPEWPLLGTMQAQAERAMPDLDPKSVIAWFKGRDPKTPEGATKLVAALTDSGDATHGAAAARAAWLGLDFTADNEDGFLAVAGRYLRPDDDLARLDNLLWDGEEDQAKRMVDRVDDAHRLEAEARMKLADQDHDALAALAAVPSALQRDAGLVYEVARYYRRQDDYDKAAAVLDPPPLKARRPDKLWNEMEIAARDALQEGSVSVAYRLAASHGSSNGDVFAEGEWLAGWVALRFLQEPDTGLRHFTNLYNGTDSVFGKARGAYWAGRAEEARKNPAAAEKWYRLAASNLTIYYGQLAAMRLGESTALRIKAEPKPTPQDQAAFDRNELVRVIRALNAIGVEQRTRSFLMRLVLTTDKLPQYRMIAILARQSDQDDIAVTAAKQARDAGAEMADYLFPVISLPSGGKAEPAFVLGLIRQESAFNADAVSPAGAMGLMQLMPNTAQQMANQLKIGKFRASSLTDPKLNVTIGRAYLDKLVDRFNGSYLLATAAYNAGPSRVRDWMDTFGDPRQADTDVVDWVESIPFDETRNYVQRVMENLQVYRSRLTKGTSRIALDSDLRRNDVN